MFSKYTKIKNCHPDALYTVLLHRYFKVHYPELTNLILHNTSTYPDGKIVASIEFWFNEKIVFVNAHIFIDQTYGTLKIFNTDKLQEFA